MDIRPFRKEHIPAAAALFAQSFKTLRRSIPILPDRMEDQDRVVKKLGALMSACPGVVALESDIVIGYMGWHLVDRFRGTDRKAAYSPEWAHSAADVARPVIYRDLYRAASAQWAAAGCGIYALTLLAHDREIENTWFWNGFGLAVIDAIRSLEPVSRHAPEGVQVRKATSDDVNTLVALEAEHAQHYVQPPVCMVPQPATDLKACITVLHNESSSYWLAEQDGAGIGFIRFEGKSFGAAEVVTAKTTIAITGAYVRPAYRGRGVAAGVLDAALRDYAERGFVRCAVDFESFNPEAAAFWVKYFEPVCFSVIRVPEWVDSAAHGSR
jgi:GNAT superfamily N-acetyltransferase